MCILDLPDLLSLVSSDLLAPGGYLSKCTRMKKRNTEREREKERERKRKREREREEGRNKSPGERNGRFLRPNPE